MTAPADRFDGTESFYARYRPGYGERAIDHVAARFAVDADARVLDLGCGTGRLALAFADRAGEVVGMDPNERMLEAARERAHAAGRTNVTWRRGSDADLGPVRLTTMGRSFHWMDGERTLERLARITEPGGGVAIFDDAEWLTRGTEAWEAAVHAIADEYLPDLPPRTGPVEYDESWADVLASAGYDDVERATFEREREWTADEVVGYVFSLSFSSPQRFDDERDAFEAEVREHLRELGGGPFAQTIEVSVASGRAPTESA